MTEPRGPIDWANQQQAEREQATIEYAAKVNAPLRPETAAEIGRLMATGDVSRRKVRRRATAEQPVRHTADTITDDLLDELYARAEQAEAERDKACTAFNAKVMQLEKANEERATLALIFEGFGRLLATSSRDWGAYRVDAWLWAVVLGWDCDNSCDDECTHDVLQQFAREFGWGQEGIDKARRYNAAVRALTEQDEPTSP